jgi:hypothetical protein
MRSQDDRRLLEDLNCQAVSAYLGSRMGEIAPLLHRDMLGRQRDNVRAAFSGTAWGDWTVPEDIRTRYTLGNGKLAFVLAAASFWNERLLQGGCLEVLSVWVKEEDRWLLLTITQDPISTLATREDIPQLAGSLTQGKGEALSPAGFEVPMTAVPYATLDGSEWGSFRWTPSSSKDVVAEVAEFHFDSGSRLFINPGGEVSDGHLWGGGPRSWRVWLVGKDGTIVTSESLEERQRKDSEARFQRACEVLQRLGAQVMTVEYDRSDDEVFFIQEAHYRPNPTAGVPEGLQSQIEEHVHGQLLTPRWEINVGSRGTMRINVRTRQPVRPGDLMGSPDEGSLREAVGSPSEVAALILGCRGQPEALWVLADWLEEKLGLTRLAELFRSPELVPLAKKLTSCEEFDSFPLGRDALLWLTQGRYLADEVSYERRPLVVVGLYAHPAGRPGEWGRIVHMVGLEEGDPTPDSPWERPVRKHPLVEEVKRELAERGARREK